MPHDPGPSSPARGEAFFRPWTLLLLGLALTGGGFVLSAVPFPAGRALVLVAGLLLCLVAVARHLRGAGWDFPERLESAGMTALVGVTGAVAYFAMDDWGSGQLFCGFLVLFSLVGSLLLLLPTLARKVALSLIVLFHFTGMVVTFSSVDPGPWLSKQLWMRVYRPYLQFLYMTNAYRFYSPDPGPAPLLWFAVHYDDGTWKWHRLPDRASSPVGMHYQRMLALPQHTITPMPRLPYRAWELDTPSVHDEIKDAKQRLKSEKRYRNVFDSWEVIVQRRGTGSTLKYGGQRIPIVPFEDLNESSQYSEPQEVSKLLISSVAKHLLHNALPADNPEARPRSVKVYRVIQRLLSPGEVAKGVDPRQKDKYFPYFLGEFDTQGHLVNPNEPFLYWYLPVVFVPPSYFEQPPDRVPTVRVGAPAPPGAKLLDCLEIHAAVTDLSPTEKRER
jgi:hypothetical protein